MDIRRDAGRDIGADTILVVIRGTGGMGKERSERAVMTDTVVVLILVGGVLMREKVVMVAEVETEEIREA